MSSTKQESEYSAGHTRSGKIIAIDGPVAAGKGTIAKALSEALPGVNTYTGGLYRALALKAVRSGIPIEDREKVAGILQDVSITLKNEGDMGEYSSVYLDGENVNEEIKQPVYAQGASIVSVYDEVREYMVNLQRSLARTAVEKGKTVILEGRDIGTYVIPDADVKIFLTASVEERARRRMEDYRKQGGERKLEDVIFEIKTRDERDMSRPVNPLPRDPEKFGYIVLDDTNLSEGETVRKIISIVQEHS